MSLCCAPLWVGDEETAQEQKESQRKQVCPNVWRVKEGVNIWHIHRCHSLVEDIPTCLTGFPSGSQSVTDMSAEKVLRQVVVQKVNSIPGIAAFFHLISSFCCVGASSSSSESSRRVSPGRAAGPGHPAPSSPACGAVWTSSAHGQSAPSPPENTEAQDSHNLTLTRLKLKSEV